MDKELFTVKLSFRATADNDAESARRWHDKLVTATFESDDPRVCRVLQDLFAIDVNSSSYIELVRGSTWEEAINNANKSLARILAIVENARPIAGDTQLICIPYGKITISLSDNMLVSGSARLASYPCHNGIRVWNSKKIKEKKWQDVWQWIVDEVMPAWDFLIKYWLRRRNDFGDQVEKNFPK